MPSKRTGHEGEKPTKGEGKKKGGRPKLDPSVHRVQRTVTLAPDIDARVTLRMMETGQSLASVVEESLRRTLPPMPRGGGLLTSTTLDTSQVDTNGLLEHLLEALLEKTRIKEARQQKPRASTRKPNNKKS